MEILFIGLGSIARRHIRNLKKILGCNVCISVLRSGLGHGLGEAGQYIDYEFYDEGSIRKWYDAIFITNPTSRHYQTLLKYREFSNYFFIEKPVFQTGYEDLSEFPSQGNPVCYVACPLRYSKVIQYLKHQVDFSSIYSIRCISSSYLPDWREGVDYRQTYSASKEQGGGVSLDLIHEWDYINYLVGSPKKLSCIKSKKSQLEIDSDDIAVYIAEYPDKIAELHLDYFGRETIRRIELFGKNDTVIGDLVNQRVEYLKEGISIDLSQERDGYQIEELQHFLAIIDGKENNGNDLRAACRILRLAGGNL